MIKEKTKQYNIRESVVQNGSSFAQEKSASNGGKPVIHEPLKYFPWPSKKE